MKKTYHIAFLSHAFMALAFMGALTSCTDDSELLNIFGRSGEGLTVMPIVSEATVVTRAESVEALNEKQLNTLDVFVEPVTDGVGTGTFLKQYHLVAPTDEIGHQVQSLLAENWRAEGLEIGKYYNIYVATNNTKTTSDVANVEALKGLVFSEVEEGMAVVDEATNNIAWPWTDEWAHTPSGNIYKQYVSEANVASVQVGEDLYGFTTEKEFMMDGVLENWTPATNTRDQVFQPVTLNRAAAKIVLNLKFDADFLHSLTHNKKVVDGTTTWEEKPASEQFSITGAPAWRFYNFAFGAKVFDPGTNYTPVEVHNSATLLRHPYNFTFEEGAAQAAQIITYTYPTNWDAADYATKAPSLVVSVPFLQNGQTEPEYHYYRIPIVKNTTTSIDRNHIYVVTATIATRGSELHEDVDEIENVYYEVLPWNDQTNSDVIENTVESIQHYYFRVSPKIYTLRGDGDQSITLNYSKASGTKVNWKLFTYDAQGNQTGVVANNASNAIRAWFYDADGDFTTTYNDNSGTNWSNTGPTPMGVKIEQSNEGTSGSSGTVTVTSTALNNKGIKYIRLRVYLDEEETFQDGQETMYEDIIIRHFPTDNIQNIEGLWSSYTGTTTTHTLTTTDLAQAQAWATQYGVSYQAETIPEQTEYINYATYNANASDTEHYHIDGPTETTYAVFHNMIQTNANRQAANSQANARADAGEGHTYYWGTDVQTVATNVRYYNMGNYTYDYYTNGTQNNRYNLYKYQHYYSATYTRTIDSYIQYSVTYTTEEPSTWVDWENRASHSPARTYEYDYNNGQFLAKVYYNGAMYRITETRVGNTNNYTTERGTTNNLGGLNNNHMYVIQISSTSDEYVLGRPYVNESTHQSQDNVVSPAFMIASQLGAVTQFTGNNAAANAATHCSRYMEVTEDGVRYTGWRLPTQSEIGVISGYQNGNINSVTIPTAYQVMTPVLTGDLYWCLSGNRIRTSDTQIVATGNAYLRCVRDLSAAEVEELNGFQKIIDQYGTNH